MPSRRFRLKRKTLLRDLGAGFRRAIRPSYRFADAEITSAAFSPIM